MKVEFKSTYTLTCFSLNSLENDVMIPFIPGIILAKLFYDLAAKFGKNTWLFAVLGALTYLIAQFAFAFVVFAVLVSQKGKVNELALSISSIAFGFGIDYILLMFLKRKWEKG